MKKTDSPSFAAGYESVQEPEINGDAPDKRAGILDPCGNTWWIAIQVK
ncbi:hypothetical protein [Metabacillus sp. FJAT-52054]|uniref:VOC family protein n=1 Tax=Metabacillus sediminis TaxID=3117746 RepID=A0ABZ2NL50_9BACI